MPISTTVTEMPAWLASEQQQLLSNTGQLNYEADGTTIDRANSGLIYQDQERYGGPRIAEFGQDQVNAFAGIRGGIGGFENDLSAARGNATSANNLWGTPGTVDFETGEIVGGSDRLGDLSTDIGKGQSYNIGAQYKDPYQQNVIDSTMTEMDRQNAMDQNKLNYQVGQSGAYGGSRHGVAESEMARNHEFNRARTLGQLNSESFQNAQKAQEAHRSRQLQGAQIEGGIANLAGNHFNQTAQTNAAIGGLDQQYTGIDNSALSQIGSQQQTLRQIGMDTDYENFQQEQNRPFEMAGFQSDMIQGVASGNSVQSQQTPNPNQLSQALGGLGQLATAGNQFGWWGEKAD